MCQSKAHREMNTIKTLKDCRLEGILEEVVLLLSMMMMMSLPGVNWLEWIG
jgi:hypothetical protein